MHGALSYAKLYWGSHFRVCLAFGLLIISIPTYHILPCNFNLQFKLFTWINQIMFYSDPMCFFVFICFVFFGRAANGLLNWCFAIVFNWSLTDSRIPGFTFICHIMFIFIFHIYQVAKIQTSFTINFDLAPNYIKIPGFRHAISTRQLIFPQV